MKNRKFIFVTGGSRSGKSKFAVDLARSISDAVVFIATCMPEDDEMKRRVELHQRQRPSSWKTFEEGREVAQLLRRLMGTCDVVVVDCLTLLISNLMRDALCEEAILEEVRMLTETASGADYSLVLVSNEVGSGLVPQSQLGRKFRDVVGHANQVIAQAADEVYLTVSGIPVRIKPG